MMLKKPAFSLLALLLAAIAMLSTVAHADTINFSINNSPQTGTPGTTLIFDATISAPLSNGAAIFLNGLGTTTPGFDTSPIDATDFFTNFPLFLSPGDSTTDALFTIMLAGNIAPGKYFGTAGILGGANDLAFDTLGIANFEIDVPGTSPVPEPGTWVLLITGAGALAGVVHSSRRAAMDLGRAA
jgi:hypothetical protein